jgi:nucleotide-binding universal stress UspA family protein
MLRNLLICTDASEASDRMVECVKDLRRVGSQQALLAHVLNVRDVGGLYLTLKRLALPKLEAQQKVLTEAGFETGIEIPLGFPAHEINRLAKERSSNMIVIGSHGETLTKEMLLGSTAAAVLQSARVIVLLIRMEIVQADGGKCCRAVCADFFKHILHPTDFSETAERAFQYLEHIVRQTKSAVTLLHVQDKAKIESHLKNRLEEFNRLDQERLERRKEHLLKAGASSVDIQIPYGSPTAHILEQARCDRYSLILMGTQGRGFLHEIFLGSVSHNVARHARLPVMFVPALR